MVAPAAAEPRQPPADGVGVLVISCGWGLVPMPSVLERLNLCRRLLPVLGGKQDVVARVRVEGWIEVNEVNRLVFDVESENVQVVAVEQLVL